MSLGCPLVVVVLTSNFVDILEGQTQGLIGGPGRGLDGVQGLQQGGPRGIAIFTGDLPALKPGHLIAMHRTVVFSHHENRSKQFTE